MIVVSKKYSVVIVAGGKGYRVGGDIPKQFIPIGSKPLLMHTIEAFYSFRMDMRIIIVLPKEFVLLWQELCEEYHFLINNSVVVGGETRFHSVKNGLKRSEERRVGKECRSRW